MRRSVKPCKLPPLIFSSYTIVVVTIITNIITTIIFNHQHLTLRYETRQREECQSEPENTSPCEASHNKVSLIMCPGICQIFLITQLLGSTLPFSTCQAFFFTLGPMKSHSHSQVCRLVGSVLRAPEVQKDSECYLAHSVQYHTVYVKRCKNHCGASQNIQQAQGRQNPQGAWQYDPEGAILMMKILT